MRISDFATVDLAMGTPWPVLNLSRGEWWMARETKAIINPLDGSPLVAMSDTRPEEFASFQAALYACPKHGLHNPFKNVERYLMLGEVCFKAAAALADPAIAGYFAKLIQLVMPKSYPQCLGEVTVVHQFLKNFGGDQVRFLAKGFSHPGDRLGQQSHDFRWPFGPVVIVAPFNFPLEIPALQLLGALFMGNRPLIKGASTTSIVIEQFLRLLHFCGLPLADVDFINCAGANMEGLLRSSQHWVRVLQFTGSSEMAERLAVLLHGRVKVEDAGFDPKIIGPDLWPEDMDYVAWQCVQDAYAASGQKCSAQSILFLPQEWAGVLIYKMGQLADQRNLQDLTVGPVLTWTTKDLLGHIQKLLAIPGAKLLFGGQPLAGHSIPECYGAIQPTAVEVPLEALADPALFPLINTEVFGPLQMVVGYRADQIDQALSVCEIMTNHLTMAVVSRDQQFINHVLGRTNNGTTYAGLLARTTGAPQNHRFGPAADPRAAGIGAP
jgi:1-pyrroline-5-carboxylate dehydrogenase